MRAIGMLLALSLVTTMGCKKPAPEAPVEAPLPAPKVPEAPKQEAPEHVAKLAANFQRVFFETDSSTLSADAKSALGENAEIMNAHTDVVVEVQGHADERGTTDYNLALGQRRADAVKDFLVNRGVGDSRIKTVSFGEETPLTRGGGEQAWSQNRRAEFRITWGEGVSGTTN